MKRIIFVAALGLSALAAAAPLPEPGTQFHPLPDGAGKRQTEAVCLRCHSTDMLAQQRLTEKQWTSAVEKMMRWGAVATDKDKAAIIAYLAKHYGPDNKSFVPLKTKTIKR
jgi:hypothetical protein